MNQLSATSFSQYFQVLTNNSKFNTIYHHVASKKVVIQKMKVLLYMVYRIEKDCKIMFFLVDSGPNTYLNVIFVNRYYINEKSLNIYCAMDKHKKWTKRGLINVFDLKTNLASLCSFHFIDSLEFLCVKIQFQTKLPSEILYGNYLLLPADIASSIFSLCSINGIVGEKYI